MIRCVTFDLDDTLWPVDPVIKHANQRMFNWLTEHAPAFMAYYQTTDLPTLRAQALAQKLEIEHSVTLIRLAQLEYGLRQSGYQGQELQRLVQQSFEVFLAARQEVNFFDHALDMLADLKEQGYLLGALSNGNADYQRVGLGELMAFHFKADEVGFMKPHPAMFEQMLEHTGLSAHEVVHVGDNPEHDVAGAQSLGIKTVWVNLTNATSEIVADAEVTALNQLPKVIRELSTA